MLACLLGNESHESRGVPLLEMGFKKRSDADTELGRKTNRTRRSMSRARGFEINIAAVLDFFMLLLDQ